MSDSTDATRNPLSRDIRLLGDLLGYIIREQHDDAAFDLEETVRQTAKDRRSNTAEATNRLQKLIEKTTLEQKQILIKAFGNYFQLINIAEDQQRIRVLRDREKKGTLSESIDSAIKRLHSENRSADAIREILNQLRLRLVLTAHPSEAKRREVLVKLRHITQMMTRQERTDLLPREYDTLKKHLAAEIEELWQTRPIPLDTTVQDEVDFGLYFVTSVIMDVTVHIYDELQRSLEHYYPDEDWSTLPRVLKYASWIGGDRDGNPNVTPSVTMQTLLKLRETARQVYLNDVDFLREHLTQSCQQVEISDELRAAVPGDINAAPYPDEPYRKHLNRVYQKLDDDAYATGDDLQADLHLVYDSLLAHRGERIAETTLRPLLRKVGIFGLHLTPLEIREDANLHRQALHELFAHYGLHDNFTDAPEDEKIELLTEEIKNPRPLFPVDLTPFSESTQNIIETWHMVAEAHERFGTRVIDTSIASMCELPSDTLAMLLFASEVNVADNIEIVPLFETIDDLDRAPAVMKQLFDNPVYRQHLETKAGDEPVRQQIMIGYSDSSKDGGYLASNWYLYNAQQKLTRACLEEGVLVEIFHGRGGSIGRGGGPTNRAIRSQPPESLRGGIKITEQGEVIAYRYSNRDIANRHLQQVMSAALLALSRKSDHSIDATWTDAMDKLSDYGRATYRDFVYETDGFLEYWQAATPINELSRLRISSRPAKRKKSGGFAAMRAIPWVFSWMQSRAIIPSWFGIGTAFQQYCQQTEDGLETLQTMYEKWRFFRAVVNNAQLDVAKADMGIAKLYASLVDDDELRDEMYGRIYNEHSLTNEMLCAVTRQEQLLASMSAIQTSIERRNPYIDPLNFIQVDLLRDLRATSPDSDEYDDILDAVLATINGIAAGMKTTG
jgi:phosphoenolpyruvate carboxylase